MIVTLTLNSCIHKYVRFTDQDPGARVVRGVRGGYSAGGKGFNAARVAMKLGSRVLAIGPAGGVTGELLRSCVAAEGLPVRLVPVAGWTRMSVCVYEEVAGRFRELLEAGEDLSAAEAQALEAAFLESLAPAECALLSGSSPGSNLDGVFARCAGRARASGKRVVLDSHGAPARRVLASGGAPPHWVRANRTELAATFGAAGRAQLEALARTWIERGATGLVVSDGPGDLLCFSTLGDFCAAPPRIREVNPVGSGDALTGAFVHALGAGAGVAEALALGAAAGAANAEQFEIGAFDARRCAELRAQTRVARLPPQHASGL